MNKKTITILRIIIIFLLCFPLHFIYDIFPNTFTSIFFPVNESIWEHMKLPFTSIILTGLLEFGFNQYFHISNKNLWFTTWIGALFSIPLYLIIYLPFYFKIGESMILNLSILLLTIILVNILMYYLSKLSLPNWFHLIGFIGIIVTYFLLAYLTYYPPHHILFYDTMEEKYGISKYYNTTQKGTEYTVRS